MIQEYIDKVNNKKDLTEQEASSCLEEIFDGSIGDDKIAELLISLADKGESISEIIGFAKTLIAKMVSVPLKGEAVDTCGTGGSGLTRFNVSTTIAFVLAAGGYPVAKHGNRGSKRPNGSFDLLEALGLEFMTTPEQEQSNFEKFNLCFLFAPIHHPIMKNVKEARVKAGRRTIFNIIGPLCNPCSIQHQVMGVSDQILGKKVIQVMGALGRKRALVVYGEPGIDEFSIAGNSVYWTLIDGKIEKHSFDPHVAGIHTVDYENLPGGDAEVNKEIFMKILDGESCNGLLDKVALNAGAAIYVQGKSVSITDGYNTAKELILSGKVKDYFFQYKA